MPCLGFEENVKDSYLDVHLWFYVNTSGSVEWDCTL